MNLTFRQFRDSSETIAKLIKSAIIEDVVDAIAIAELDTPAKEIEELYTKGNDTIVYKFAKKAQARDSEERPGGYNTIEEVEEQAKEMCVFLDTLCTAMEFNFKPISQETFDILFKGTPEIIEIEGKSIKTGKKVNNITAQNIAVLKNLGMYPIKKGGK